MSIIGRWRMAAACVLIAGALALSACIVSPGKFAATLDLRRDGTFTFTYDGEIYLLALSQLASMASEVEAAEEFVEQPCYDDDNWEERACTAEELAVQREDWAQQVESRRESARRDAEMTGALLGGIDPSDPQAAEELAERLRRQEGWQRVDYRGDGLFEVRFALTSRVGHDFTFPTFERFAMSNAFVVANLRKGRYGADRRTRLRGPGRRHTAPGDDGRSRSPRIRDGRPQTARHRRHLSDRDRRPNPGQQYRRGTAGRGRGRGARVADQRPDPSCPDGADRTRPLTHEVDQLTESLRPLPALNLG